MAPRVTVAGKRSDELAPEEEVEREMRAAIAVGLA